MKIIYNNIIPPKGYKAITLFNVIFVRKGKTMSKYDLNHEAIHWEQEKELWIIGFYIAYVFEFLYRLCQVRRWHGAYRSISFEQECYFNERNLDYITTRKRFAWRDYE